MAAICEYMHVEAGDMWRTRMCLSGSGCQKDHCQYAHEERKLRKAPRRHPLYKTIFCAKLEMHGRCPDGVYCEFAHSFKEMRCPPIPGPRIRRGAWRQEICAARSLGKRVFCDNIKIATNARKLHCFGKFAEFMMLLNSLVLKLPTCGHSVMFTKV